MNERFDDASVDAALRAAARTSLDATEFGVGSDEIEGALAAVHLRTIGDSGRTSVSRDRPSPWLVFGTAAAVVALVVGGIVVASRDRDDTLVTGPDSSIGDPTTTSDAFTPSPATTTVGTSTAPTSTSVPLTQIPNPISVDSADPPGFVEPEPFVSIPLVADPDGRPISVAIGGDQTVAVHQPGTSVVTMIRAAAGTGLVAEPRDIPIPTDLSSIVLGPLDIVYGLGEPVVADGAAAPSGIEFVAAKTTGDGGVVASGVLDIGTYLELPTGAFGHGPDGVIDRVRRVNETVIGYVDESGAALRPDKDFPLVETERRPGGEIVVQTAGRTWVLDITRDPTHADSFVGPMPAAPTSFGRIIYTERIGADTTPDVDFGPNEMPVIAVLEPNGDGTWVRLPDDWDVVASEVFGTVLMRVVEADGVIELAYLDDALGTLVDPTPTTVETTVPPSTTTTVPPSSSPALLSGIERRCVAEFECGSIGVTESGDVVAYDPIDNTLLVFDPAGIEMRARVQVPVQIGNLRPGIVDVGPDDVVYLSFDPPDPVDPIRWMIAVALDSGREVGRWTDLDGTGDSDLVPTREGLAVVGCCGPESVRPGEPLALYPWLDSDGNAIESDRPVFRLELRDAGDQLVRTDADGERRFSLPTVAKAPRGMPPVWPTDDGGGIMIAGGAATLDLYVIQFGPDWPEFGIDRSSIRWLPVEGFVPIGPALSNGAIVIESGDGYRALDVAEIGTASWPGELSVDDGGVVTAPGLNDFVEREQPGWAASLEAYGYQLVPDTGANELLLIEPDEETGRLVLTVTGLLDDSVGAVRYVIDMTRASDGLFRFERGSYGWRCQPGRGHQDFSTELCV